MLEHHTVVGPAGNLETLVDIPEMDIQPDIIGIICHPHPQFGGTMYNKVVTTVAKAINKCGIKAVRFNYRGVGQSEGSYGEGVGELADLVAMIAWIHATYAPRKIWLAGFSFGACLAMRYVQAYTMPDVLITVAPPVSRCGVQLPFLVTCPWLIVMGNADEVASYPEMVAWTQQLPTPPYVATLDNAGHFFNGRLMELRDTVAKYLVNYSEVSHG